MVESQQYPRNPRRNFTPQEAKEILDHPRFQKPTNFTKENWERAIQTIRSAIKALFFDLPIIVGESEADICRPIRRLLAQNPRTLSLYYYPDIHGILNRMKNFADVRLKLASASGLPKLLEAIMAAKGQMTPESLRNLRADTEISKGVISAIRKLVRYCSPRLKKTILALVDEFLSEQAGVEVKIADGLIECKALRKKRKQDSPKAEPQNLPDKPQSSAQPEVSGEADEEDDYYHNWFFFEGELPPLDPKKLSRPEDKIRTLEDLKRREGKLVYLLIKENNLPFLRAVLVGSPRPLVEGAILLFTVFVDQMTGAVSLKLQDAHKTDRPIVLKSNANVRFFCLTTRNPY